MKELSSPGGILDGGDDLHSSCDTVDMSEVTPSELLFNTACVLTSLFAMSCTWKLVGRSITRALVGDAGEEGGVAMLAAAASEAHAEDNTPTLDVLTPASAVASSSAPATALTTAATLNGLPNESVSRVPVSRICNLLVTMRRGIFRVEENAARITTPILLDPRWVQVVTTAIVNGHRIRPGHLGRLALEGLAIHTDGDADGVNDGEQAAVVLGAENTPTACARSTSAPQLPVGAAASAAAAAASAAAAAAAASSLAQQSRTQDFAIPETRDGGDEEGEGQPADHSVRGTLTATTSSFKKGNYRGETRNACEVGGKESLAEGVETNPVAGGEEVPEGQQDGRREDDEGPKKEMRALTALLERAAGELGIATPAFDTSTLAGVSKLERAVHLAWLDKLKQAGVSLEVLKDGQESEEQGGEERCGDSRMDHGGNLLSASSDAAPHVVRRSVPPQQQQQEEKGREKEEGWCGDEQQMTSTSGQVREGNAAPRTGEQISTTAAEPSVLGEGALTPRMNGEETPLSEKGVVVRTTPFSTITRGNTAAKASHAGLSGESRRKMSAPPPAVIAGPPTLATGTSQQHACRAVGCVAGGDGGGGGRQAFSLKAAAARDAPAEKERRPKKDRGTAAAAAAAATAAGDGGQQRAKNQTKGGGVPTPNAGERETGLIGSAPKPSVVAVAEATTATDATAPVVPDPSSRASAGFPVGTGQLGSVGVDSAGGFLVGEEQAIRRDVVLL